MTTDDRTPPRRAREQPFRLAGWRVDPRAGELRRAGQTERLQPRVMDVLLYLVEHAGQVVSKQELLAAVWPDPYVGEDALWRCIGLLRRVLGDDPKHPQLLETVPRRGYRLLLGPSEWLEPEEEKRPINPAELEKPAERRAAEPEQATGSPPSRSATRARRAPPSGRWVGLTLALLTLGSAVFLSTSEKPRRPAGSDQPTLVLLPFETLSTDAGDQQLAALMTEDILGQVGAALGSDLGIAARSTTFGLSDPQRRSAAGELGFDYLLDGAVLRTHGRLRISVQLVRTSDQLQVWAKVFEGDARMLFALNAEIGQAVVTGVAHSVLGHDGSRPTEVEVRHAAPAIYEQYLLGKYLLHANDPQGLELLEEVVLLAPEFAQAHATLAEARLRRARSEPAQLEAARQAVARSLELAPELAEAWNVRAKIEWRHDWDLAAAKTSLDRALAQSPHFAEALHNRAIYFSLLGRHEEALVNLQRARALDPMGVPITKDLAWLYFVARRPERAIAVAEAAVRLEPANLSARIVLFQILDTHHQWTAAAEQAIEIRRLSRATAEQLEALRLQEPQRVVADFRQRRVRRLLEWEFRLPVQQSEIAFAQLQAGDPDSAIERLERAFSEKLDPLCLWLPEDPRFEPLARTARGKKLLQEIALFRGRAG